LGDILLYTEQEWGSEQRLTYGESIRDTIATLATSPGLGRRRDDLHAGLRCYPVGSHMLYYWHRDNVLFIAHILHRRRDPKRLEWGAEE
jgi:toxin ParE1/3/4